MDKSDDAPSPDKAGFPRIEHVRLRIPGDPEKGFREIIIEERGLRSFVRREQRNPFCQIGDSLLQGVDPVAVFNSLLTHANHALVKAGERDFTTALLDATEGENELMEGSLPSGFVEAALLESWREGIAKRHGYLSPEATAADFLIKADRVRELIGSDEAAAAAVFALCEAWHWHHMEATGEHALAAGIRTLPSGYGSVEHVRAEALSGLARGPEAVRARKVAKLQTLEDEFLSFRDREKRPQHRDSATEATKAIIAAVNKRLVEAGLSPYKKVTIRKEVTKLLKRHRRAP